MTLICPGYSSSFSMRRAMSFESQIASSSVIFSLSTMMRISRPACSANDFDTPLNESAMPLELLEPLHVRLEDVAAGAGTRRRDRVGGLHDHRFERRPVDVHVVRRHGHHDRFALAVLAQEVDADLQVRPFHLAVDRLADVVEERGAHGARARRGRLPGHDAGEAGDFRRVRSTFCP